MSKIKVQGYSDIDLEYRKLSDVKQEIERAIQEYGENAHLELYPKYGDTYIRIAFERLETDHEYQDRITKEENDKVAFEQREKKQFARLLKKYGNAG
jgi:hypothetical protein